MEQRRLNAPGAIYELFTAIMHIIEHADVVLYMQSLPLNTRNSLEVPATRPQARPVPRAPIRQSRALAIGLGFSALAVVCLMLFVVTTRILSSHSMPSASSLKDITANIVIHAPDGEGCQQRRFDNRTGRLTEVSISCASPTLDENGRPVIKGTTGRLNEIGKSFRNH
jgi:hypothetical protein